MTIARVRTILYGPQITGGGVSDLYFLGSAGDEQSMVSAVALFWTTLAPHLHDNNFADTSPEVVNINEADGSVVSIVTVATDPAPVEFANQDQALPLATQGLIRWRTGTIVNNRALRGRMFVPCLEEQNSDNGRPNATAIGYMQDAADALLAGGDEQLVVWHRPGPAGAGAYGLVQSASVWTEWAVLRSRRD